MSKIAKKPIKIEEGVKIFAENGKVRILGPKGELSFEVPRTLKVRIEADNVFVDREGNEKPIKSMQGLFFRLLLSAVKGVSQGWERILELVGTGYRARMDGKNIVLSVGFSHPVVVEPPEGISFAVEENRIKVAGYDKHLVGQVAANMRRVRPPEPYKGKGIRYLGEEVARKPGKAAKVGAAA
ncbi:MAG: 50S ribosomal protein L6 [Candidatus Blackburnbacteria bacterium]|nr:50S ribosomal protein L6 [Candidatus Blackburnbacteria bacterium]